MWDFRLFCTGEKESRRDVYQLIGIYQKMENKSINLVFDRTFFTEENYCRLGKKDYTFTDVYEKLLENFSKLDFDIYYITLYLKDVENYHTRLNRKDKATFKNSKYESENSINQQRVYLEMAEDIKKRYPNIKVANIANDRDFEETKKELREFIGY